MRSLVLAGFVLVTVSVALQDPKAPVVKASRFELIDAAGRTRAVLGMSRDGSPELDLRDPEGRPRALLLLDAENLPVFFLKDSDVITRAKWELNAKGAANLSFHDPDLTPRLELDGRGVRISDSKGVPVWKAP